MKWTRASERLPENNPDKLFVIRITFKVFEAEVAICYYADNKFVYSHGDPVGEINDKIEWLDESPESSVWPGVGEAEKMEAFHNKYSTTPELSKASYLAGFEAAIQWLQSRTAVKAESPSMSAREFYEDRWVTASFGERTKTLIIETMEEYANQFKQSQPTAVKAEDKK